MNNPRISILLPVYNAADYIKCSVESVLNQTFKDFELLIIDDNSTDDTLSILNGFNDSRIKIYRKEKNTGYTNSLNIGIDMALGDYIARMDADDECLARRFEKQIHFLELHPDVALCGTDALVIGSNLKFKYPSGNEEIKVHLLFGNSLIHPSVMGKSSVFKNFGYDVSAEPAEDYDLFTRLAISGKKLSNLDEPFLKYRVHKDQTSEVRRKVQDDQAKKSMLRMFKCIDYDKIKFDDGLVMEAISPTGGYNIRKLRASLTFFKEIRNANNFFDEKLFQKAIDKKEFNYLKHYIKLSKREKQRIAFCMIYYHLIKNNPYQALKFLLNNKISWKK